MSFAWPFVLWALFAPLAFLLRDLKRRRGAADQSHPNILHAEASSHSVTLVSSAATTRKAKPRYWCVVGCALAILALARPQWGRVDEPVFEQAREILIAMDLSRSMLTQDVKPSRLDRSKLLIQSLLDKLQGERVGLVLFSGTSFLQAPMSADYEVLRDFLPALTPDYMPEGGTNYHDLLSTSLDAFGSSGTADRYLIILSDGEATDNDWKDLVPDLQKRGIKVIGLGVGTEEGGMIPEKDGTFLKDETGAVVKSHLESSTLKQLADASHGVYRDASSWVDLASLIQSTVDTGVKGSFREDNNVRLVERFQWVLAPALMCLLMSLWKEFPARPRARAVTLKTQSQAAAAVAALLCFVLLSARAFAQPSAPQTPADLLGKIVGRLANADTPSALDWSELGHATIDWARQIDSEKQPVPAHPIRDALAAADRGEAMDPKATDWKQLKSDLRKYLKNDEDEKKDQQKKDQQNQQNQDQNKKDQDKKDQNQQKQDKGGQDQKQDSSKDQQSKDQKQQSQQNQQDQKGQNGQNQQPKADQAKQNQGQPGKEKDGGKNAFDFSKPSQPPSQPQGGTKQVGGTKEDKAFDPAQADPSLAVPLQKLDQLKNDDSPAQLYQLMRRGEPAPPQPQGKNW